MAWLAQCCGLALLLASTALSAAPAPPADPMHTPECLHAQAQLNAALQAADARGSARLQRARRQALELCLGREAAGRERSGAPYPAQAVPPIAVPGGRVGAASPAVQPLPPLQAQRPGAITMCDPGGCWDSAGRRLNRVAPGGLLSGPHGPCLRQGGLVTCP